MPPTFLFLSFSLYPPSPQARLCSIIHHLLATDAWPLLHQSVVGRVQVNTPVFPPIPSHSPVLQSLKLQTTDGTVRSECIQPVHVRAGDTTALTPGWCNGSSDDESSRAGHEFHILRGVGRAQRHCSLPLIRTRTAPPTIPVPQPHALPAVRLE